MWPFKKSIRVSQTTAREFADVLARHEREIAQLRDDLLDLTAKHTSLRGRVYATGLHKAEQTTPTPAVTSSTETKAELRKRLGILPGRPYNHGS